jgi:hypothetical protein
MVNFIAVYCMCGIFNEIVIYIEAIDLHIIQTRVLCNVLDKYILY